MKIAFQDKLEWYMLPHAEKEIGIRMRNACVSLNIDAIYSSDAGVISQFSPDIVFPLHHYIPKIFDSYTIGCMWNPPAFLDACVFPINSLMNTFENIKSYDAYAIASSTIDDYLNTINFRSPIVRDKFILYPSSCKHEFPPVENFKRIAYVGSNWQGDRHKDLFLECNKINVYGPENSWEYLNGGASKYCGEVPFGNDAIYKVYRENGIGLCFHSREHLEANVPNMRIFEMAASGILIFADRLRFIEENFGDSVIYIDTTKSTEEIIEQIDEKYYWALSHPQKATEMAFEANKVFNKKFSLEKLIGDIVDQYNSQSISKPKTKHNASVEIIMRTDGKRSTIKESINSIADQTYKNILLTFIYWGESKDLFEEWIKSYVPKSLKYRILSFNERKDRSFNFYSGIRNAKADYIGFCDDDDILFKNHVESLVRLLKNDKTATVAYSGSIVKETKGRLTKRDLAYFHEFFNFENTSFITSNSYLVRKKDIPFNIMNYEIPYLSAIEDKIFLDCLFLSNRKFLFSESVTCLFTRDLKKNRNVSYNAEEWDKNMSYYRGFIQKSSKFMEYVNHNVETPISFLSNEKTGKSSRFLKILRFLSKKLIPHRIRRYILLIVKELISSSNNI
ncbi:glycosyltransferase [Patescibacteria group bacterium]|nr:glycosyltransferase [Patescibacteria group bacterium]